MRSIPLLASRVCHFGASVSPSLYSGRYFRISEAPWVVILATRGHPGRPWEQWDGHEVVRNTIFIDFGVILEPVYVSFLTSRRLTCHFCRADASRSPFVSISEPKCQLAGFKILGFRTESIAKFIVSPKSFFANSGLEFCCFLGTLGTNFPVLQCLQNKFKNK